MTQPQITDALAATLDVVARDGAALADPWWVFGSAAMALAGLPGLTPPDVDLIVSEADAEFLIGRWGAERAGGAPSPLFRSKIFARAHVAALTIEIMAGFEACSGGAWSAVVPQSRQAVAWGVGVLHVPSIAEQAAICRRFGRPKDLQRAALLEALA